MKSRLFWFFLCLFLLVIALGTLGFFNYTKTQKSVKPYLIHMVNEGPNLTISTCLDETLNWFKTCDGIQDLCESTVIRGMFLCLKAKDRTSDCQDYRRLYSSKLGYEECVVKREAKGSFKKACANVYQSIFDFCRIGPHVKESSIP